MIMNISHKFCGYSENSSQKEIYSQLKKWQIPYKTNIPKLTQEEKEHFNGLPFVKESLSEIKALLRKTPRPKTSLMNSTKHLIRNEKMMSTIHHKFQKTEQEEYLLACFLIRHYKKGNCRPICLMNIGTNITDKILTKMAIYEDNNMP